MQALREHGRRMNLKYISIGALAIILAIFYFMYQSNKESEAKIESAKNAYIDQQNKAVKIVELQKNLDDLSDADALKLIESSKIQTEDMKFYRDLSGRWSDAIKVASASSRVDLSGPVKELQIIKRELSTKATKTYCEEYLKFNLVKAYDYAVEGFLSFMKDEQSEMNVNTRLNSLYMDDAIFLQDYCKAP